MPADIETLLRSARQPQTPPPVGVAPAELRRRGQRRRTIRRSLTSAAAVAVLGVVAFNVYGLRTQSPGSGPSTSGGHGAIQVIDGLTMDTSNSGGLSAVVSGTVSLSATSCWQLTTPGDPTPLPIVWPAGTHWADDKRQSVQVPSGDIISVGTAITGGGGYMQDIDRASVSIDQNVPCLTGDPLSWVSINDDVRVAK
jgi:hypothetical protein